MDFVEQLYKNTYRQNTVEGSELEGNLHTPTEMVEFAKDIMNRWTDDTRDDINVDAIEIKKIQFNVSQDDVE